MKKVWRMLTSWLDEDHVGWWLACSSLAQQSASHFSYCQACISYWQPDGRIYTVFQPETRYVVRCRHHDTTQSDSHEKYKSVDELCLDCKSQEQMYSSPEVDCNRFYCNTHSHLRSITMVTSHLCIDLYKKRRYIVCEVRRRLVEICVSLVNHISALL